MAISRRAFCVSVAAASIGCAAESFAGSTKPMIAKHYNGLDVTDTPLGTSTTPLPAGLHVLSGQYVYKGVAYDLREGGLYRFYDPSTLICEQKLVQSVPEPNVYPYISGLSWLHADGPRDAALSLMDKQILMRNHYIEMNCGDIADLCVTLLGQYAQPLYPARRVQMLTAGPVNGHDDGHIVFEVKIGGAWRLFDVTNGRYFADSSGSHLNLKQIIEIGMSNCTPVRISEKIIGTGRSGQYSNRFYYEFLERNEGETVGWCQRIYQIPVVGLTAYLPPGTESRQAWVQSLGFTVVSQSAWGATYYPA